jgi:hypothetical protein
MLICMDGRIVPRLAKAWHTPGLNGNDKGPGHGDGFLMTLSKSGWKPVPHGMTCVAFGTERTDYLSRWQGRVGESSSIVDYWTDAWHRPRQIGHLTRWEFDAEGWRDFLSRCLEVVWTGDLDPLQIELATAPVIRTLRSCLGRESIPARQAVAACCRNLPEEHVPADLLEVYRAQRALTKPKGKAKATAST